jgi:hypothetical protein
MSEPEGAYSPKGKDSGESSAIAVALGVDTDALTALNAALGGVDALKVVVDQMTQAAQDINAATGTALGKINGAVEPAIDKVNSARDLAINMINLARSGALEDMVEKVVDRIRSLFDRFGY